MFAKKGLSAAPAAVPQYVEDVFSTYLYTGDGSGFSVNNGIDLSGEGGMVWLKDRTAANLHMLFDTNRGATYFLRSTGTDAQSQGNATLTAFNNNGFTIGDSSQINTASNRYASWTFRKAEKFFDVQTWTGTGTSGRQVAHNLGSVPGCVIIKCTSTAGEPWYVYHRSVGASGNLLLNTTDAASSPASEPFDGVAPTSTYITLPSYNGVNGSGKTYVGYFFAHDAGGFGDAGDQSVVKCGSFVATTTSTPTSVNLGWEPQFLLVKASTTAGNWLIMDNMRGMPIGGLEAVLRPNLTDAEATPLNLVDLTPTGFDQPSGGFVAGETYIYIAIRRGPMKTPEAGTSVFTPVARSGTGSTATVSNSITTDLIISHVRNTDGISTGVWDRLRGVTKYLETTGTAAESTGSDSITALNNTAYVLGADSATDRINRSGYTYANWTFSRAPGFFDVVCYTGTGSATTFNHNLGVAPELIIAKKRNAAGDSWAVYAAPLTSSYYLLLNSTQASTLNTSRWTANPPTSTIFRVGTDGDTNDSGATYVAYLFATLAGVSKVGTYTGTGATLQINCGFTSGARFVLIKKTDSSGTWFVFDTARGIAAGTDRYLTLNSTDREDNSTDIINPYSSGFELTSSSICNFSGGTYLYLAIA